MTVAIADDGDWHLGRAGDDSGAACPAEIVEMLGDDAAYAPPGEFDG